MWVLHGNRVEECLWHETGTQEMFKVTMEILTCYAKILWYNCLPTSVTTVCHRHEQENYSRSSSMWQMAVVMCSYRILLWNTALKWCILLSYDHAGAELEANSRSCLRSIPITNGRALHSRGSALLHIHTHQRYWACFFFSCRHTYLVNRLIASFHHCS
jgi:hypothetical protein